MNYGKYGRKKKLKQINSKATKLTNLTSSIFIRLLVFGVILLGIIGVTSGIGVINAMVDSSPELDELLLNIEPEGFKSFIYDQDGNELQELYGTSANRVYVEYDQIPEYLSYAYVAIEDERFFEHNGVDIQSVIRAGVSMITENRFSNPEGASTITQQVIKNNVLTTEVTIERKVQEMNLAIQLEENYTKEEILELYMNTIANGNGTNGVQTASNLYFGKDVWDISLGEAAVLAAITNNPVKYNPISNPENNRDRAVRILDKLLEQEYITQSEYDIAFAEDVYSNVEVTTQTTLVSSPYSYFVDETITSVVNDLVVEQGYTEAQAYNLVYYGGISIYATQDLDFQTTMDDVFNDDDNFPTIENSEDEDASEPQAAMVIMDPNTGYVKALTGGRGEKEGSQTFNRATEALRQPGSTFKVLAAYLPAIDAGDYSLATVIDDVPLDIEMSNGTTYSPKNWYSEYKGLSNVREGIVYSMNILAVKTIFDIGIDVAFDYLLDLGFTSIHEEIEINDQIYTDKTLSLPLGGLTEGVTPLELSGAYSAIQNGGTYVEPIFYTKVLDGQGNIILENEPETRTVMKDTTAFLLTDAMKSVVDYGTGTPVQFDEIDMELAGKTGTTSSNKDLWFAGYSPYYTAVVWMGHDDPEEMNYNTAYHKSLWKEVMEEVHKDLPYKEFEMPNGIVQVEVCSESGLLPSEACEHDERGSSVHYEYFTTGTVPTETCDVHVEVEICDVSGLLATEYCPEDTTHTHVYIDRPTPLEFENLTEAELNNIADYQYEMPHALEGEYCNIHGPETLLEESEIITEEEIIEEVTEETDN